MHTPWPGDLIAHMARKIYKGYSMISAWTEFPRGVVIGHPRSHVLRIQADFPEAEGHTRRKAIANRRS
jgi:hypothetical protein